MPVSKAEHMIEDDTQILTRANIPATHPPQVPTTSTDFLTYTTPLP